VKTKTVLKRKLLGEKPSDWASGYSAELALLLAVCAPPLPRLLLAAVLKRARYIFCAQAVDWFLFSALFFFSALAFSQLLGGNHTSFSLRGKKKWKQIFKETLRIVPRAVT
jgi:hypothetical protein